MPDSRGWLSRHGVKVVALAVTLVLYGFTRLPSLDPAERRSLAAQFAFERLPLLETGKDRPLRTIRDVHPQLDRISGWISAVGASVALHDVDGDGLSNDLCLVDPRTDRVTVAPVPATGGRFEPILLSPEEVPGIDPGIQAPMGCLLGDLNEDGLLDALVYYWGRTPVAFLRHPGGGATPSFRPVEVVDPPEVWNTNAFTRADVDGDGHLDLIVGNYFQDGAFVLDPNATSDFEMQNSMSRARNGGYNRVLLWKDGAGGDEPTVTYREAEGAFDPELARGWTLAMAAGDLDGDLLPEIYAANDFGPDTLFHNRSEPGTVRLVPVEGRRTFWTPASKRVGRDSFKGMGVDFADLDDDGRFDIYVSNIAEEYALEESHFAFINTGDRGAFERGVAPFQDRSERLGLARSFFSWEARLADFNNDGSLEAMQATGFVKGRVDRWPELQELAIVNDQRIRSPESWPYFGPGTDLSGHVHNPFFVRASSGRYFDLAPELGMDQAQVSRGIAVADVDGDGALDFALANQWARSWLYRNRSPAPGAFLGLRLRLSFGGSEGGGQTRVLRGDAAGQVLRATRPAIGAVARVHLPDGTERVAQVDGGNGHSGARSPELHFGLGEVARNEPVEIEIAWRDGAGTVRRDRLMLQPGWHTVVLGSPVRDGRGDA